METTQDSHLIDPSDRINRPPRIEAPVITDRPSSPDLQLEVCETTWQTLARETRRRCWSPWSEANANRPGDMIQIGDTVWLLWLDRAETMAMAADGQPHAAVIFDRIEG